MQQIHLLADLLICVYIGGEIMYNGLKAFALIFEYLFNGRKKKAEKYSLMNNRFERLEDETRNLRKNLMSMAESLGTLKRKFNE